MCMTVQYDVCDSTVEVKTLTYIYTHRLVQQVLE